MKNSSQKVDSVLILSAGLGKRMRHIGKERPKVLWPIFEKTLLELQIAFAKKLAPDAKIFLNIHFLGEAIEAFLLSRPDLNVEILREDELLDIGGAVHNLCRHPDINYKGSLLVLNCDQFLFLSPEVIKKELQNIGHAPVILFPIVVDKADGYNEVLLDSNRLMRGILPNKEISADRKQIQTYSGVALIALESLETRPKDEVSNFFKTVADYKKRKVLFANQSDLAYWDFGTAERYWRSHFSILSDALMNKENLMLDFLRDQAAFHDGKMNVQLQSYGGAGSQSICLAESFSAGSLGAFSILMAGSGTDLNYEKEKTLFWHGCSESIEEAFVHLKIHETAP